MDCALDILHITLWGCFLGTAKVFQILRICFGALFCSWVVVNTFRFRPWVSCAVCVHWFQGQFGSLGLFHMHVAQGCVGSSMELGVPFPALSFLGFPLHFLAPRSASPLARKRASHGVLAARAIIVQLCMPGAVRRGRKQQVVSRLQTTEAGPLSAFRLPALSPPSCNQGKLEEKGNKARDSSLCPACRALFPVLWLEGPGFHQNFGCVPFVWCCVGLRSGQRQERRWVQSWGPRKCCFFRLCFCSHGCLLLLAFRILVWLLLVWCRVHGGQWGKAVLTLLQPGRTAGLGPCFSCWLCLRALCRVSHCFAPLLSFIRADWLRSLKMAGIIRGLRWRLPLGGTRVCRRGPSP